MYRRGTFDIFLLPYFKHLRRVMFSPHITPQIMPLSQAVRHKTLTLRTLVRTQQGQLWRSSLVGKVAYTRQTRKAGHGFESHLRLLIYIGRGFDMELIKLIKQRMIQQGRDDFVNYLAEILNISKQWASVKMSGKSSFTDKELAILDKVLDFDANELKSALGG